MTEPKPLCYWRELWRLSSGFSNTSSEDLVFKKLNNVQDQLCEGLCFYQPASSESFSKLSANQSKYTKALSFIEKLQNFMGLDSLQTWDVFCHYLSNQYHGTVENALNSFSFTDVSTNDLLLDVWSFYNSERLFMLKQLGLILEFKSNVQHCYFKEFTNVFGKMNVDKIKASLIKQFKYLIEEMPPTKVSNGDMITFDVQRKWMERNLREQVEVLLLLFLTIDECPLYTQEYKQLIVAFKSHNFGRQPIYYKYLDENHTAAITKIIYAEVAIFYKIVNDAKGPNASAIISNIKDEVESELIRLQHNEEHGALLLAWMLLLLEDSISDEMFTSRYQHFGTKALQLRVFEFLNNMCKHPMFSGNYRAAKIFRSSVYWLLSNMCNKFDGDGSMATHPGVIELCTELLSDAYLAKDFWNSIDKSENMGVVSLWNTALEYFPFDFKTLSSFVIGLSKASTQSFENLLKELDNLPIYTEIYRARMVAISNEMKNEDDVILSENFYPYGNKDLMIKSRSHASIMDRRGVTLIHFRTIVSYWKILYNEIQSLLKQSSTGNVDLTSQIDKVTWGILSLNSILKRVNVEELRFNTFIGPCEAVFDVLVRFSHSKIPYTSLISSCLELSAALIPNFSNKIFVRLMNIKLLPYVENLNLSIEHYANGETLQSSLVGHYLVNVEQPNGEYQVLSAYLDIISAFYNSGYDNEIGQGILLPGLIFILREVFPHMFGWYFKTSKERLSVHFKSISYLFKILQGSPEQVKYPIDDVLIKTCLYSLLNVENGITLLKLVSFGEQNIQALMAEETNWVNGPGIDQIKMTQMSMSVLMHVLRLKHLIRDKASLSALEHLIYTQPKQKDTMKVVPIVTGYINHVFNKHLPNIACRLLRRFALESHMSLLVCLNMSAHQIRTMFLERLRDGTETPELKTAILEFVSTCVDNQPGLTEVFFKISHLQDETRMFAKEKTNECTDGILTYMAEYLSAVKNNTSSLYSPLLSRIMGLFHALWKNNMQMLVRDLRQNPEFWEYLCSPLFHDILPEIKAYSQIYNMMGIELYLFDGKVDKSLQTALEKLFSRDETYLKKWLDYIFSNNGSELITESIDETPGWLSLLTSWKDFVSIIMKHLPFTICAENKYAMASICLNKLNIELESMNDSRIIIVLAEMYVIYFANWKTDCFDDSQEYIQQIAMLLSNMASSFDCLHHRARYSILAICTLSLNMLTYDLKEEKEVSHKIISSICRINNLQLDKLYVSEINKKNDPDNAEFNSVMMGLRLLEQCVYVLKNEYHCWNNLLASTNLVNKLMFFTMGIVQKSNRFRQTLAALNCLTAFARSSVSKELLYCNISLNLWLKFLPPKELVNCDPEQSSTVNPWNVSCWWQIYRSGIEFVTAVLEKHGNYFSSEAIMFTGVHEEYLVESILLIKQTLDMEALNLSHSTLYFVSEMIKYESKWKHEHYQSLITLMRSISTCLHYCITLVLRPRGIHSTVETPFPLLTTEETDNSAPTPKVTAILNKLLELMHLSAVCLKAFSPDLLSLLTNPGLEISLWQPLMEIQFGAPKLSSDPYPQLTFGTVMSAVSLLTRSLNYTYHAEDVPLNSIKKSGRKTSFRRRVSGGSGTDDSARRRTLRSDSVTSVSSTTSTSINPNWLAALDKKLVVLTLENLLTLLASQALLAAKDPNMSTRDKQLVRRELCAELPIFHDFVKKKVIDLSHPKSHLCRRKYGIISLVMNEDECKNLEMLGDNESESDESMYTPPSMPRKRVSDSFRVSVVRKLHLDKTKTVTSDSLSKISNLQDQSPSPSTSKSDLSLENLKSSSGRSTKHVTWDEISLSQDENKLLSPEDPEYCMLSEVQMVEEDYLHFLSNLFLYICQTDHFAC